MILLFMVVLAEAFRMLPDDQPYRAFLGNKINISVIYAFAQLL
jgi:hypothetical protein